MSSSYRRKLLASGKKIALEFISLYQDDVESAKEVLQARLHGKRVVFKKTVFDIIDKKCPGIEYDKSY